MENNNTSQTMSNNENKEGGIVFKGRTEAIFKVIVVGDPAVGKTALTLQFSKNFFKEDYNNTVGVDFHSKTISIETREGPIRTKLQFWDTGGLEKFASIRPMYIRGALGAIVAFDLSKSSSFEHLPQWIENVRFNVKSEIPILLVGNKCDLIDQRQVSLEEINVFTRNYNLYYMETSAKTGEGVFDCMYTLTCLMLGLEIPKGVSDTIRSFKPPREPPDDNNERKDGGIVFKGRTEEIYKVIVIGDPAAGKTELLAKYTTNQFEENYLPTVGVSILKEPIELNEYNAKVNLMFWDIAGQPQFYMLHRPYFNGADGMLLVFDVTRSSTFSNINNWYSAAVKYGLSGIPRILIGNKAHIKGERRIILPMAEHLAEKLNAHYYETSALSGENIKEVFEKIAEEIWRAKDPNKYKKNKKLIIKPYQGKTIEVPDKNMSKPAFMTNFREPEYEPPSSNFPRPSFPRLYKPRTTISKKEKKKKDKEKKRQQKEKAKFEKKKKKKAKSAILKPALMIFPQGPKPKSFVAYTPHTILSKEEEEKIRARKKKREQKEKAELEKEKRKSVIYGFTGISYYAEFVDGELTKEE